MEANKDKSAVFDVVNLEVLALELHSIRHKPKMCVKARYCTHYGQMNHCG
jgi:hypothetical protein